MAESTGSTIKGKGENNFSPSEEKQFEINSGGFAEGGDQVRGRVGC